MCGHILLWGVVRSAVRCDDDCPGVTRADHQRSRVTVCKMLLCCCNGPVRAGRADGCTRVRRAIRVRRACRRLHRHRVRRPQRRSGRPVPGPLVSWPILSAAQRQPRIRMQYCFDFFFFFYQYIIIINDRVCINIYIKTMFYVRASEVADDGC